MDEFFARAQLVMHRIGRVKSQAVRAAADHDVDRLAALNAEMELLTDGMAQIREEQLIEQIERVRPKPKRRWWSREGKP